MNQTPLSTILAMTNAWGQLIRRRVTWLPEDITDVDPALENVGQRRYAFATVDDPPVRLYVGRGHVRVTRVLHSVAGMTSRVASCIEVDNLDDLAEGTYFVEEVWG